MRKYFVTRRDWEVGPIFEAQLQQMIDQRWFREGDLVRAGDVGSWQAAERFIPEEGFGSDEDEVILVDVDDEDDESRPPPVPTPFMLEEQQRPDAVPLWFRHRAESRRAEEEDDASEQGTGDVPRRSHPQRIQWSDDDGADDTDHQSSRETPSSLDEFRFQTAEFQVPSGYVPPSPDDEFPRVDESPPPRERSRGGRRSARPNEVARSFDEEPFSFPEQTAPSSPPPRKKPKPAPLPSPLTSSERSGELHLPDTFRLDADSEREAELLGTSGREAPEVLPEHRRFKPRSVFDDDEDEEPVNLLPPEPSSSKSVPELDFSKLANLASHDPRISHVELPTTAAPPPLLTPEERSIRTMVVASRFGDSLDWLLLGIGAQACLMSVVVNGLVYAAFKRLFILSMEVFIPFEGSSEALGEENLAVAGVAMACSIALPVLPLTYLIKIDGRVIEYGITLVVAMFAAAFINSTEGGSTATTLALLMLAAPAGVTAGLYAAVASLAEDPKSRMLAAASVVLAGLTTAMVAMGAPRFGIVNGLHEFPPVMSINSAQGYGLLLLYGLQSVPTYLLLRRLGKMLLDRATQEMVNEHFTFHGMLTAGSLFVFALVEQQGITSWFAIPAILTCLTMLAASGFNLWSLGTHFMPQLERLRRDRERYA